MKEINCKLLVIGAGPGGYVCAIRAGQLGVDTVIVEAGKPGGTCLNVGCIPSKALIHVADEFEKISAFSAGSPLGIKVGRPTIDLGAAVTWKDGIVARLNSGVQGLLRKAKVKIVIGTAKFRDGKSVEVTTETGTQLIYAQHVVVATGSVPVEVSTLPFGGAILSSTEALALTKVPAHLAVIGGGYIGLELGTAFAKLGSRVTIVEAMQKILPQYDADLTKPLVSKLERLGVRILTETMAKGPAGEDKDLVVEKDGTEETIKADKILVTVGRRARLEGCGLEELDLEMNGRFIRIDDQCRTSMRGVYAIGDVTGDPMLAHRATAQGEMVAEIVAGKRRTWDKRCIPAVCFTDPEIATAGLSPDEARASGLDVKVGQFPFLANGRSMTMQAEEGFVRVVSRADSHLIVGIQAVGAGVSELSSSFAQAIENCARLEDIAGTIHAHPTRSEAFQEAAMKALGHALHS